MFILNLRDSFIHSSRGFFLATVIYSVGVYWKLVIRKAPRSAGNGKKEIIFGSQNKQKPPAAGVEVGCAVIIISETLKGIK